MRKYVLRSHVPARNPNNSRPPSSSNIRTYVTYLECERNQAERIGGIAYDGCLEFLASGPEGTPAALICAACQCNRSFHRLVVRTEAVNDDGAAAAASSSHPPPPPPPPPAAQGAVTTT